MATLALGDQGGRQKLELAGEVLVDEEDVHGLVLLSILGTRVSGNQMTDRDLKREKAPPPCEGWGL